MINRIILMFITTLLCGKGFAFDHSNMSLDKVIKSGEVVFVGFVNGTSVINRSLGIVKSHADIVVEECLRGGSCEKGKKFGLDYLAKVSVGTSLPVELVAGTQVIIILTRKTQESPYVFDSDITGGTDFLLSCDAFPYSILDEQSVFNCKSAMTGRDFNELSIKSIKSML